MGYIQGLGTRLNWGMNQQFVEEDFLALADLMEELEQLQIQDAEYNA